MTVRIRAHFDGKTIVPDEPVEIPAGTALDVEVKYSQQAEARTPVFPMGTGAARRAAIEGLRSLAVEGLSIPDEALRREHLYGEDER